MLACFCHLTGGGPRERDLTLGDACECISVWREKKKKESKLMEEFLIVSVNHSRRFCFLL